MSQAQRGVIALLMLLVMWCAWQSRLSSQHSENNGTPNTTASGNQHVTQHDANSTERVQIDCDPNCTAEHSDNNKNQSILTRGVAAWLRKWQTLVAATVALIAACVAFHNTTRSLRQAAGQETSRRKRKHAALRAVLPLALSQVADYAERSARALDQLAIQSQGQQFEQLPRMAAPENLIQPLPSDTLKALAGFIEYSDTVNVVVLEDTVAWIQIHNSRVRHIVQSNRDQSGTRLVVRHEVMASVIDAAAIYAGASAMMQYSRRQRECLPRIVSWQEVKAGLLSMGIWNDEYDALVTRREAQVEGGAFGRLREELLHTDLP